VSDLKKQLLFIAMYFESQAVFQPDFILSTTPMSTKPKNLVVPQQLTSSRGVSRMFPGHLG